MQVATVCFLLFLIPAAAFSQAVAPTEKCEFHGARADAAVRELSGPGAVPYMFACGVRGPGCMRGSLPAGLVVSVDREKDGWSCVTGGDSTSGWVESVRLQPLPQEPKAPLASWIGTWHRGPERAGMDNDRLVIGAGDAPGSLRVDGKAFWYGAVVDGANVEHLGEVHGIASPVGNHLHVIESAAGGFGCVLDLSLKTDGPEPRLTGYDNKECGGMNVSFGGTWTRKP